MLSGDIPPWAAYAAELLRTFATGSGAPQNAPDNLDFILPELRARKIDSLHYRLFDDQNPMQQHYRAVWQVQREAFARVSEQFAAAGIAHLVFKGAALTSALLDDEPLGMMGDADFLVEESALMQAHDILRDAGFAGGLVDVRTGQLVPRPPGQLPAHEFELHPMLMMVEYPLGIDDSVLPEVLRGPLWRVEGGGFVVSVEIDLHFGLAIDIEGEDFLARRRTSSGSGWPMPAPADHLWFLTSRYYVETALHGKNSLREFAYIAGLIERQVIEWDLVVAAATKWGLYSSVYYFLRFAREVLGCSVPDEVTEAVAPTLSRRTRDYGWQLGKLFDGIEPLPW